MIRAALLVAGATLAVPMGMTAQQDDLTTELRAAAERVAAEWRAGSPGGLGDLLRDRGIRFHAGAGGRETLEPRKALAALEDLMDRRRTATARVIRVALAEGSRDRGSAEISWEAVAPGTSELLRYTLFVGFLREEDRWRIYEIRVLP